MTKLVEGESRVGRPVMPAISGWAGTDFDAVWTGRYFLVAAVSHSGVIARTVTADGEQIGEPFELSGYYGYAPRLAYNGKDVLMISASYGSGPVVATKLTPEGRVAEPAKPLFNAAWRSALAVTSSSTGFAALGMADDGTGLVTFDRTGAVRSIQNLPGRAKSLAVASDGKGYRAMGVEPDGRTWSFLFDENGSIGATVTLGDAKEVTSLVWTGRGYASAVVTPDNASRIDDIAPDGHTVASNETVKMQGSPQIALASFGGRVVAAWSGEGDRSVRVSDVPLTNRFGTPATFGASQQKLLSSAVSNQGSLVLWSEERNGMTSLHAGLRGFDGSWKERAIDDTDCNEAFIASDGREFLALYTRGSDWYLRRLDAGANPVGDSMPFDRSLEPLALIWNGHSYVVVGRQRNGLAAAFLTATGFLSTPVMLRERRKNEYFTFAGADIATNGQTYLVTWVTEQWTMFPVTYPYYESYAARFDANLRRLDPADLALANGHDTHTDGARPSVAWDGLDFVIAWTGDELFVQKVPVTGHPRPSIRLPSWYPRTWALPGAHVATVGEGVVVAWRNDPGTYVTATVWRGGTRIDRHSTLWRSYGGDVPQVIPISNRRTAIVGSSNVDAPPHHGSRRLQLSIVDYPPPPRATAAPQVDVKLVDGKLLIEWMALASPVNGYRVEYRIGDGNWNEIERSPDPGVRTAMFKPVRTHKTYSFRVRGTSDGGMGPYSEPAVIHLGKQRSVR